MSTLGQLYRELERRRVIRVVTIYCIAAWIIIEAADVVLPALFMPDWILRLIIILAFIGLPFAVAIAWVFDLTSGGVVRTPDVEPAVANTHTPRGRWIDFAAIAVLLGLVVYLWQRPMDSPRTGVGTAIAVLPFADLSPQSDSAYLGDGIAEELLNSLANLEGVRVAARTSSFAYRNSDKSIQDIGSELSVDTVLEGSVRKSGDQLRITAQLIDVSDGFHLWSSTFDRRLDDIFAIQDEIATSIADAMRVELLHEDQAIQWATSDITAYELYLKGRHELHGRTAESLDLALSYFQQAIDQDNQFAPAHAGLAEAAVLLREYGNYTLPQARAIAEPAIEKALIIDPGLADAYAVRGLLLQEVGLLDEAEQALREAIGLDADNPQAHLWLGNLLMEQDKPARALAAYERAHEIEPLMIPVLMNLSEHLHNAGRYGEARGLYLTLLKIRPQQTGRFRHALAKVDKDTGALASSARWLAEQLQSDPFDTRAIVEVAMLYALLGDYTKASKWLTTAQQQDPESGTVLENLSFLLLQQGKVKEHRRMAEAEIERFGRDYAASGSTLPPSLYEWGGYAAYFDGDYPLAYERFSLFADSYSVNGRTIINRDNFEALCFLLDAADRSGASIRPSLRAGLREFLQRYIDAGNAHHDLSYGRALFAAAIGDAKASLLHLATAVDRGWRLLDSVDVAVFSALKNDPAFEPLLQRHNELLARERELMPNLTLPSPPSTQQIRLSGAQMGEYVGRYRGGENIWVMRVYEQEGELWARFSQVPPRQLVALGSDQFRFDQSSRRIQMFRDDGGEITHLEIRYEGHIGRMKRVPETRTIQAIELTAEELEAYVGVFDVPSSPQLPLIISRQGSKLFIRAPDNAQVELIPESRLSFYNEAYDAFIQFEPDDQGDFTQVVIRSSGTELRGFRGETE